MGRGRTLPGGPEARSTNTSGRLEACATINLFLLFLGRGGGFRFAHGAGLAAGGALFGFAAGVDVAAAFFAGKGGHGFSSD